MESPGATRRHSRWLLPFRPRVLTSSVTVENDGSAELRYAVSQTSGNDLSAALLKLYQDNASTLTPDPLYVKFYYSHPPASERLERMGAQASPA